MRQALVVCDGLFHEEPDGLVLHAARCAQCGATVFPAQDACPHCMGHSMRNKELPPRGTLWAFTIQRFRPKAPYDGPEEFEPYGVGYVQFGDDILVEGRLTENDPENLHIGQAVAVVPDPYTIDQGNGPVVTFAFEPIVAARTNSIQ